MGNKNVRENIEHCFDMMCMRENNVSLVEKLGVTPRNTPFPVEIPLFAYGTYQGKNGFICTNTLLNNVKSKGQHKNV